MTQSGRWWATTRVSPLTEPSSGDELVREDLCVEAIRLARVLVSLMLDRLTAPPFERDAYQALPERRPSRALAGVRLEERQPHRDHGIAT